MTDIRSLWQKLYPVINLIFRRHIEGLYHLDKIIWATVQFKGYNVTATNDIIHTERRERISLDYLSTTYLAQGTKTTAWDRWVELGGSVNSITFSLAAIWIVSTLFIFGYRWCIFMILKPKMKQFMIDPSCSRKSSQQLHLG